MITLKSITYNNTFMTSKTHVIVKRSKKMHKMKKKLIKKTTEEELIIY